MSGIIATLIGFCAGVWLGVFVMAAINIAHRSDGRDDQ